MGYDKEWGDWRASRRLIEQGGGPKMLGVVWVM